MHVSSPVYGPKVSNKAFWLYCDSLSLRDNALLHFSGASERFARGT